MQQMCVMVRHRHLDAVLVARIRPRISRYGFPFPLALFVTSSRITADHVTQIVVVLFVQGAEVSLGGDSSR